MKFLTKLLIAAFLLAALIAFNRFAEMASQGQGWPRIQATINGQRR